MASTQDTVAEMYVASVMMVDAESCMVKSYLDELARGAVELERQGRGGIGVSRGIQVFVRHGRGC